MCAVELSYCVVNTDGRRFVIACLEAIRATAPDGVDYEVLLVDNASADGSADAVAAWNAGPNGLGERLRLIRGERRRGKAELDGSLLAAAGGTFCVLLNEDSELRPGAVTALLEALRSRPDAAVAGATLLDPNGNPQPSAWRLPGVATSLASAAFAHRPLVVQSRGAKVREVGWVQSAAMLVRRTAALEVGGFDPDFFVYSDETDFQKRLHDAGWKVLFVPGARAVHHEQLATDPNAGARRVAEFHRGRDRYMRKHHSAATATATRWLSAWAYGARAAAARVLPGHDPAWYRLHVRAALHPERGEGLREAAEDYNRRLDAGDDTGART